jgi:hypothetical protein
MTIKDKVASQIEGIGCTGDCFECPYFLQLDICRYAYDAERN